MQVSPMLIQDATLAIQSTENEGKFILLTSFFNVNGAPVLSFENDVEDLPFHQKIPKYLFLLNNQGYAINFIDYYLNQLVQQQLDFPQIKKLSKSLSEQFIKSGNQWKINNCLFDNCLIKKNLAFLDRSTLRRVIGEFIDNRKNGVLILKGQPKAGLSYIKFFLSEIQDTLQNFVLVDLDLKKKIAPDVKGLIYAAHIASVICNKTGLNNTINLDSPTSFKVSPFLSNLKTHLSVNNERYLFFIDQFDTAMADDAYSLINGIAEETGGISRMQLVLSNYDKSDDWDFFLEQNSVTCNIDDGNISISHVQEFFENLYDYIVQTGPGTDCTKENFVTGLAAIIKNQEFYVEKANATVVGRYLSRWYKAFSENIT